VYKVQCHGGHSWCCHLLLLVALLPLSLVAVPTIDNGSSATVAAVVVGGVVMVIGGVVMVGGGAVVVICGVVVIV